jgi:hypothetical protein
MQEDRPESEFHSDSDESFDSDPLTREDIAAVVAKMEERAFKGRIHLIWRRKPLPRHHYPCPEKIVTSSGRFLKYQEQLVLQLDEFQEVGKVATYHPFPNLEEIDYLDIQLRQEAVSVIRGVDIVLATDIREAQRVRPAKRPRADVTPTQVGMEAARTDREPPPAAVVITNVTATPSDWARFADVEDNRAAKKELLTLAQSGTLKVPLEVPAHYVACYPHLWIPKLQWATLKEVQAQWTAAWETFRAYYERNAPMPSDKEKLVNMIKSCVDSLSRGTPESSAEWNSLFQLVLGVILKILERQMSDGLLASIAEKFNKGLAAKVIDIIAIVDEANIANEQAQKKKSRQETTPPSHDSFRGKDKKKTGRTNRYVPASAYNSFHAGRGNHVGRGNHAGRGAGRGRGGVP